MGLTKTIKSLTTKTNVVDSYINVFGFRGDGLPVLQAKLSKETSDNNIITRWGIFDYNPEPPEGESEEEKIVRELKISIVKKEKENFIDDVKKLAYKYVKKSVQIISKEEILFSDDDDVLEEGQVTEMLK